MRDCAIFSGTANRDLAEKVSAHLRIPVGDSTIDRFPDGEIAVQLLEPVRRRDIFLLQPLSPPVNDHLMELLALADACRRAAAGRITAVIPYFGYARSDKRHGRREPIAGRMVADLIESVGIDHVITMNLHAPQIEGFFRIPVDTLTAVPTIAERLRRDLRESPVVVAPDAGALRLATEYAGRLGGTVAVLHKQRMASTETKVTRVVGDVAGKPGIIVDDMISTGGTVAGGLEALRQAGMHPPVIIAATHGLLLPGSRQRLAHPDVSTIIVTDTVRAPSPADWPNLEVVSIAPVLAAALERLLEHKSFSDLY
ncbi:ribose-phosphate diphosphokinase [Candidatus Nitrospira bockiana]